MLKVGLIGVGGISAGHIPAWANIPEAELTAICDVRPEQLEKYPALPHYTSAEEMLAQEQLDIVDICLPTFLHAEYAIMAMEKGIHVICEKPAALCAEEIDAMYATAEKNGVKLMIAQVVRFWSEYAYLKNVCHDGRFGKLLSGSMWRIGSRPNGSHNNWMLVPEKSGMVPFDLHIHDLDYLVHAFGAPKGHTVHRAKTEAQDLIHVVYQYDDFFVSAESSWYNAAYPFTAGFRFQFENALVAYEGYQLKVYGPDGLIALDEPLVPELGADPYQNEIRYFVDCVLADAPVTLVRQEQLQTVRSILCSL